MLKETAASLAAAFITCVIHRPRYRRHSVIQITLEARRGHVTPGVAAATGTEEAVASSRRVSRLISSERCVTTLTRVLRYIT